MADCIVQLSENVANQIAAGEVVGRPASVVKELVENAVDAEASEIVVLVKNAGRTLVQVTDNGKGMSEEDAKMCFKRHATSKISNADDLLALVTKGFRGEALASISAIAQVVLKTREKEADLGVKVQVSGNDTGVTEAVACAVGTSFSVKNLFFNVPARRNFLKSDPVELRHIIDEFQRVAMAHPEISFRLEHNGTDLFNLKRSGLRQRVVSIFGVRHDERLVPVDEETEVVKISGFVGKPSFARRTRGEQFLFVNGRFIKHPLMHKAIMNAYEGVLTPGNFPLYTIFLEVAPSRLDVNIHPTKIEAKFQEDSAIYAILRSAVKRGLGMHDVAPSLDFETELSISIEPLPANAIIKEPEVKVDRHYNPFEADRFPSKSKPTKISDMGKGSLGDEHGGWKENSFLNEISEPHSVFTPLPAQAFDDERISNSEPPETPLDPKFFQLENRFIITTFNSRLILIDPKRAHERILYEGYLKSGMGGATIIAQKLLFPEPVDLPEADIKLLLDASEILKMYGLELNRSDKGGIQVSAIPSGLAGRLNDCLEAVLEALHDGTWADEEGRREILAAAWSKAGSISGTKVLNDEEIADIISRLFKCESPAINPYGRNVFTTLKLKQIEEILN